MAHKFNTLALHAGISTDETGSRGVPLHRTASYLFKNTEHAANLFALKELGNIYTRIQNPTQDVLEQRVAALENGAGALALASGTAAIFYTIINICSNRVKCSLQAELRRRLLKIKRKKVQNRRDAVRVAVLISRCWNDNEDDGNGSIPITRGL